MLPTVTFPSRFDSVLVDLKQLVQEVFNDGFKPLGEPLVLHGVDKLADAFLQELLRLSVKLTRSFAFSHFQLLLQRRLIYWQFSDFIAVAVLLPQCCHPVDIGLPQLLLRLK